MINIERAKVAPPSLERPEIKDYLDAVAAYANGESTVKPPVVPAYRNSDLLTALDQCFHGKCYLTEQKFPNSWALDVEHFIPKSENPQLRYEWSNLFPAEASANQIKPRATPPGGYLNPTVKEHDVERRIVYSLIDWGRRPGFNPRDEKDQLATNTSALLERIHNGHDTDTEKRTEALRYLIFKRYQEIMELIVAWQRAKLDKDKDLEIQHERELRNFLSRRASFTMLLRSAQPIRSTVPKEFMD